MSKNFNLEKARAEVDTASSRRFSESREQARIFCAEEILPDALDEIERLRAALDESEQILAHKTKTATHWYDEHLQARADRVQTRRVVEQQAARIQELEDAHKRSGVKYAKIINELRSSVYANIPGLKKQWDEILNAPANGKIGPDADAKPHCWQITEERKAAILHCKRMLTFLKEDDAPCYDVEKITKDESVLVAMLEEAQP